MSASTVTFPVGLPANPPFKAQSTPLAGSDEKGYTPAYRNAIWPELLTIDTAPHWPKTGHDVFEQGRRKVGDAAECLGHRPWDYEKADWAPRFEWQTYGQIAKRRDHIGAGLLRLVEDGSLGGSAAELAHFHVGIWAVNMPQWQLVNLACAAYGLVNVSLYDTLGPDAIEYCTGHAECRVVFTTPNHIPALLKIKREGKGVDKLKVIVSLIDFDDIDSRRPGIGKGDALREWAKQTGIKLMDFTELESIGMNRPAPHRPPTPEDIAAIAYTSGTTGNPKGAVFLHKTIAAVTLGHAHGARNPNDTETLISYMPLSHCYERFSEDLIFLCGGRIGYSCGDLLRLLEDIQLLQPTTFPSVPRVLNRLYNTIKAQTIDAPGLKGALCRRAVATKLDNLRKYGTYEHALYDRLVFNKVKKALGGKVRLVGSGSAPISPDVLEFLKVVLVCDVSEGYGQTEGHATCNRCWPVDHDPQGSTGPPIPVNEIRLKDVPEMGYFSTDKPHPRGELCIRGQNVIPGYYKDEAKTRELMDGDSGWMRSGDIALVDDCGRFKIIDRIKNLVKLAQGEYVAVEKIDNVYGLCPLSAQIFTYADSLKNHLILFVVPDPATFAPFASKVLGKTIEPTDTKALVEACQDRKVTAEAFKQFDAIAAKQGLRGFERAKQMAFWPKLLTIEDGFLTPTQKIKRPAATKAFKPTADKLFAEHEQANAGSAKSRL